MSPPIQKDWWLAAALTGAALPAAVGQVPTAAEGRQTGIVTSVTQGVPTTGASTPIYIDNTRGQRLTTGPNQTLHVLFSDQSAITVGPNSQVVIAEYRYDSRTKDGNLLVDMSRGLLRMVGGFLSKRRDTMVRTGTLTLGIRGGITIVEHDENKTSGVFLFGESMHVSNADGTLDQLVTRQGFGVTFEKGQLSEPQRVAATELASLLGRFEPSGGSQQAGTAPDAQPPSSGDSSAADNAGDNMANDRLPVGQDPNQPQNINSAEALRNILGTAPTTNQS